ncbi:Selenocysteine lyase [Halotydeus destructor]|nr:Selenocysteine lyase [Halotydeus destructor]
MKETTTSPIYLDYNATTPVDENVVNVMMTAAKLWANPSSSYDVGVEAAEAIAKARQHVNSMLNVQPGDEIIFTSGGTEANNWVIHSCLEEYNSKLTSNGPLAHIITTNVEHDSIKLPLERFAQKKLLECSFVAVDKKSGSVDVDSVLSAIKSNTVLITVMLANNETGVIMPVKEISLKLALVNAERAKSGLPKISVHTDAAQAIGKIPVDTKELHVDFLTIVGHKFYGPRIGALFKKSSVPLHPLFFGGGQESSHRPGTQNVMAIAGLGEAAHLVHENIERYKEHMSGLQEYLETKLLKEFGELVHVNGSRVAERLPNTTSLTFLNEKLKGSALLKMCKKIRASVGAACHSHEGDTGSSVLVNSGVEAKYAACTIRLSVGRETSKDELNLAIEELSSAVKVLSE